MRLRPTGATRTMPVVTKIVSGKPGNIFPDLVNSQIRSRRVFEESRQPVEDGSDAAIDRLDALRRGASNGLQKRPSPWTPGILAREVGRARSKLNGGRN